jgi:hypothetical protein
VVLNHTKKKTITYNEIDFSNNSNNSTKINYPNSNTKTTTFTGKPNSNYTPSRNTRRNTQQNTQQNANMPLQSKDNGNDYIKKGKQQKFK